MLFPIGYDAFGLPTENFAIKNHIHPAVVTRNNVDHFRSQLKRLGFSFDYSREINTTDPSYYKWTQFIFLKLTSMAGLQKRDAHQLVHQLQGGPGQRGGRRRRLRALRLRGRPQGQEPMDAEDHRLRPERCWTAWDDVDFIEKVKLQQRNWIGRSEGAEVEFSPHHRRGAARVHHPAGHALWRHLHGALAGASADRSPQGGDRKLRRNRRLPEAAARKSDFERTELARKRPASPSAASRPSTP